MDKEIQLIHEEFFKTFDKDLIDCYDVCLGKACSKIFEFMRSNKFWRWLTRMNHASSIRVIRRSSLASPGNIDVLYTMKEKDVLKIYRLLKSDDSLGEAIAFVVTYLVENGCPMEQIVAALTAEPLNEASMRSYCIDYDIPIFGAARKQVANKIEDCLMGLRVINTYCKWMKYDDPLILACIYLYGTRVIDGAK